MPPRRWRDQATKAVQCLEKDIGGLLVFFNQDKKLWIKWIRFLTMLSKVEALRTTNVIERMFRELRKRTRPMTHFVNIESGSTLLTTLSGIEWAVNV